MELGTLVGMIVGAILIVVSIIITAAGGDGGVMDFLDAPSAMIVIGGTLASGMIGVKLKNFLGAFKAVGVTFKPPSLDPAAAIDKIVQLANTARKEGVLALEESAASMDDAFLKKGVMLIVDGTDPELVKGIMETELSYTEERHGGIAAFYENLATYAPSWGMMGTMIGLVLMLGDLNDPDNLGPMMAVALITTFYGCIIANYLCNPIASKLKDISKEEILFRTVMVEGMLSIQAGENPRIIEEKLKSFLAPALRSGVGGGGGGAAAAGGDE
ncbi:MAG: motility protein A [Defluviitaleaceae bacterium]|nr:motility protein A [Defluviitaleaceae bacterium]MCL2261767.1 motility protein A [Defluviitaleaceae bacterium]